MLNDKDYCDHNTCVTLEELGFPIRRIKVKGTEKNVPIMLYEAQKWLREEEDIHIEVYACTGGYIYELRKAYKPNSFSGGTTIYTPNDVDNPKLNDDGRYDSFETCLSEGIKESVKILKEFSNVYDYLIAKERERAKQFVEYVMQYGNEKIQ